MGQQTGIDRPIIISLFNRFGQFVSIVIFTIQLIRMAGDDVPVDLVTSISSRTIAIYMNSCRLPGVGEQHHSAYILQRSTCPIRPRRKHFEGATMAHYRPSGRDRCSPNRSQDFFAVRLCCSGIRHSSYFDMDACYDKGSTFLLKWLLNDGAP